MLVTSTYLTSTSVAAAGAISVTLAILPLMAFVIKMSNQGLYVACVRVPPIANLRNCTGSLNSNDRRHQR